MNIIETNNLTHVYSEGMPGAKTAISNINISVKKGEFLGIIGHTGSGKSTLIQHFNALLKPTSGRVLIEGEDIWEKKGDLKRFRFKVGLVFQYPEYQLFEETVRKDISFGPNNMGLSKEEVDTRVERAMQMVRLDLDILDKSPFDLSGGQKRRVAIAGVIAMEPEVLILDEPAAGLDPLGRNEIMGEIKRYHEIYGKTVIIVSHSMEDIAKYSEMVMVMNKGEILYYDTVKNIFSESEKLQKIGLEIPAVTEVMIRLKNMGYPVDITSNTVSEAVKDIIKLVNRG
ncbi:MAG: energy-coupling factor transporter ATPase [Ruminococcaceae bacterium]|mgnify:CR=1 FL=1|nr:energy-coupling factor transporter ATPase [Oscillospiraceae bacterium]